MVFAQTLGVKLTMKQSYLVKLETVLFPLIILMISFPIIIQYVSDNVAWTVSIFLLVLIGFGIGLTTSYTAAIAGMLGPSFIGPLMQGYSFGFVVVGLLRLICLLAFNGQDQSDYFKGTILYFSLNTVILTVMALSIPIFLKQDYIKLHLKIQSKEDDVDDIQKSSLSNAKFDTKATTMKIWLEATTIFVTFLLSYMLYPSILYQKQQVLVEGRADWSIFIINMSFALSDLIGRTAAKLKQSYSRPLLITSMIVRLLFIASSFLIALSDAPFWNSPATVIINAILLGFTNGFFATAACNTIPGMLENNEKEFGGFVMSVMINGGIAIGSIISLVGFSGIFEK